MSDGTALRVDVRVGRLGPRADPLVRLSVAGLHEEALEVAALDFHWKFNRDQTVIFLFLRKITLLALFEVCEIDESSASFCRVLSIHISIIVKAASGNVTFEERYFCCA